MCPVDASVAVWLCAVRTLKRWKFFSRVSRVELHDQGQDFLVHLCQSQVPVVPESPGALLPGDLAPGLPIRSFSCVDIGIAGSSICVKNNNIPKPFGSSRIDGMATVFGGLGACVCGF